MNDEEQEAKKSLFLKIGVSIIIAIVFFLWLANLKGVFESKNVKQSDSSWQKISADMDKNMKNLEQKFTDSQASSTKNNFVKDLISKTDKVASSSSSTSTTTAIVELKKDLEELTKSTTTNIKIACPPYINCMPTIGEMRPCAVPPGCEDITQITY